MKRSAPLTRKTPLARGDALKRRATADHKAETKRRKTSGFTAASTEQRIKVAGRGSIVSGESPCDPAHLTRRPHGGCEDALCVIPLTRIEHRAFDDGKLDILDALVEHGMWAEMAHAIEAHHVTPQVLLQRCTGERYVPETAMRQAA